jgi:hypothetical protein
MILSENISKSPLFIESLEVWVHKRNLTPSLYIEVPCTKAEEKWAMYICVRDIWVMYICVRDICVRDIDFISISTIFLLYFGTTVLMMLFYLLPLFDYQMNEFYLFSI